MKLTVKKIVKSFGENEVLKNISFDAESGKALGLLGRNGAGKTTTIRIIMGVFPPDDGEIYLNDKLINRKKLKIGYLPEERGLYPKKVILEQLTYLGCLSGLNKKEAISQVKFWLNRLEMTEYINRKLESLSKGNQQKIQFAATLLNNPDIIILDEPFSGLDPVNAILLKDIVNELIQKNKIVLFSSHQMNYIEEFCDSIVILDQGEIVLKGNINEIKRTYDRKSLIIKSNDINNIKKFVDEKLTDIISSTDIKKDLLIVNLLTSKIDLKNRLINEVSNQNFDIDSISVYEPSLNDIFVEYTGDEKSIKENTINNTIEKGVIK